MPVRFTVKVAAPESVDARGTNALKSASLNEPEPARPAAKLETAESAALDIAPDPASAALAGTSADNAALDIVPSPDRADSDNFTRNATPVSEPEPSMSVKLEIDPLLSGGISAEPTSYPPGTPSLFGSDSQMLCIIASPKRFARMLPVNTCAAFVPADHVAGDFVNKD